MTARTYLKYHVRPIFVTYKRSVMIGQNNIDYHKHDEKQE